MTALATESPTQPAGLRTTFLPAAALAWHEQQFEKLMRVSAAPTSTGKMPQLFLDVLAVCRGGAGGGARRPQREMSAS
eukprot:8632882-Alexandrium_andersonii.AAC.1